MASTNVGHPLRGWDHVQSMGIPEVLFCQDIKEAAEGCIMLNYANPNAMITWACNQYGQVPTIGLCHGVQHGHAQIATF